MNRSFRIVWVIVLLAGITVVCNQTWQLYRLFEETKDKNVHEYKNIVKDALAELSMLTNAEGSGVSFNMDDSKLIYFIDGKRIIHSIDKDVSSQWIKSGPMYDIRDTTLWTLEALNDKIQQRILKWRGRDSLPLELVVKDSLGRVINHFQYGQFQGNTFCHFTERLGFLTKDTLEVSCDFTFEEFWANVKVQVWLIVTLMILLIFCITALVKILLREKRASAFRELFVQAFVHDLKLPVSNALKCLYLLEKSLDSSKILDAGRRLTQMHEQLTRVQRTIVMLLTAMADEHGVTIQPGEVDLHELLCGMASSGRWQQTSGKTFKITIDWQVKNPLIEGDEILLETVFQNLIENALKYSEEHVDISIISQEKDEKSIQLIVADTGLGIPEKALRKIFLPRYRIPEYMVRGKGTGIGLSVTQSIIKAHGGTIRVESELGRGSRFIISLPYQITKGWKTKLICYMRKTTGMRRS